jgi:hypothetical protein
MFQITLGLLVALLSRKSNAFVPPIRIEAFEAKRYHRGASSSDDIALKATPSSITASTEVIQDLKFQIENEIKSTKRGLSASPEKRTKINSLVQSLESLCPYEEPARMPEMEGKWIVDYTTAPPPSNGKLGPFEGIARQIIDLDDGTYINYLSVPGDIEKEFLSAKLEATFEEWDGELLKDDKVTDDNSGGDSVVPGTVSKEPPASTNWLSSISPIFQSQQQRNQKSTLDYGANSWKVDFKTLTIKLFGFKVLEKSFDEGTSRVWKMSYLDKDGTRVVRAGRTGNEEDAMMFYMQKE